LKERKKQFSWLLDVIWSFIQRIKTIENVCVLERQYCHCNFFFWYVHLLWRWFCFRALLGEIWYWVWEQKYWVENVVNTYKWKLCHNIFIKVWNQKTSTKIIYNFFGLGLFVQLETKPKYCKNFFEKLEEKKTKNEWKKNLDVFETKKAKKTI
jgi:hypothetical protein